MLKVVGRNNTYHRVGHKLKSVTIMSYNLNLLSCIGTIAYYPNNSSYLSQWDTSLNQTVIVISYNLNLLSYSQSQCTGHVQSKYM